MAAREEPGRGLRRRNGKRYCKNSTPQAISESRMR